MDRLKRPEANAETLGLAAGSRIFLRRWLIETIPLSTPDQPIGSFGVSASGIWIQPFTADQACHKLGKL